MLRNLLAAMAFVLAALGGLAYGGSAAALDDCIGIECTDFFEEDPCADPNATLNWKMCGDDAASSADGDSPDQAASGASDANQSPDDSPGPVRPDPAGDSPCKPRCLNWKLTYTAPPLVESGASR